MGSPIRKSAGLWIFAPNRSLSQLVTSFFGSWCQVILPTLFIAWPAWFFRILWRIRVVKNLVFKHLHVCPTIFFLEIEAFTLSKHNLLHFDGKTLSSLSIIIALFSFQGTFPLLKIFDPPELCHISMTGGDEENRTPDPLLARQVLSQLSYTPVYWWA